MPATSTLAASCVALSTAIIQILSDAGNFARRVRDARHEMNAISSELLAIKTSLEIAHDDFSSTSVSIPPPLLDAISGILGCCGHISGQVHKAIIKLSAYRIQSSAWDKHRVDDFRRTRRHLETLHAVLDLALDQVSIFTLPSLRSNSPSTPGRNLCLQRDTKLARELLTRIDTEKERITDQTEDEILSLECWLAELKICAEATLEGLMANESSSNRSNSPQQRKRSPRYERNDSAQSASRSSGTGIGAWIDSVASHVELQPVERPESILTSVSRIRDELQPSRSTFYTESSTAGSIRSRKPKQSRTRSRSARPQPIPEGTKTSKQAHFAPSITFGAPAPERVGLRQYINADKIAIAKSKRLELSPDQVIALDRDLRNIGRTATHATVERMLWIGANPNVEDSEFGFLFIRAAFDLSTVILRLLVKYGADITKSSTSKYFSVLHACVLGRQLESVQFLIELGTPIDAPNSGGETALHLAAKTPGAYPIAKYLLEMGADVNTEAKEAETPLHVALIATKLDSRERSMMVELLLAHGAEGELNAEPGKSRGKGLSVLGII
ncbi:hypothetical protein K505DRAFT_240763 [Melanomma pulvis-pyrius CBS 109.77]|uniref:Uncharacterized protein n=1 Tax=Melanomma pulvis-pyrius CBS 109.77 TaxID=1314802 RepID=A0A6A6XFK7_9PLEO|nr:hypothetical protein K505DRAFT_240763 [Melanomma pulvis-pyrius CBS 109.77]